MKEEEEEEEGGKRKKKKEEEEVKEIHYLALRLLPAVFGSTAQRIDQSLVKQGMCTYCQLCSLELQSFLD